MVGIPGKSKGCTTCRRRKVRCDLGKPSCQRCTSSGRCCEGYARYSVFINRGPEGLQRRKRLEETRADGFDPSSVSDSTSISQLIVSNGGDRTPPLIFLSSSPPPPPPPPPPLPSSEGVLRDDQLISNFFERYASPKSSPDSRYCCHPLWLYHTLRISFPTKLLRQALLALAYTRLGRLNDDHPTITRGQRLYGQALRLMQQAVYDADMMRHEDTLAAARCMLLYEHFESTSDNMTSWFNHIIGISRIVELRGPRSHRTALTQSLLESMRYSAMIISLMERNRSAFGRPAWLTEPWLDGHKSLEQRIIDYGFHISNQLHRGDLLLLRDPPPDPTEHQMEVGRILHAIQDGLSGLEALHAELGDLCGRLAAAADPHEPLDTSCSSVDIGEISALLGSAIIHGLDLSYSVFAAALLPAYEKCTIPGAAAMRANLLRYTDQNRRHALAHKILVQLQTCVTTEADYSRGKIVLPLNIIRWTLRTQPEDTAKINELFDHLTLKGRYRLTRSVQNTGKSILPKVYVQGIGEGSSESKNMTV
ncbi:uncharacterized protein PV06_07533 [Exophiala oligosperma]|uniref:Zn(2)-C6 fungal-type domain-containing protein n=1 Tax=Exophiala oligosperma TaxID=215243 RepID=A0A0D2AJL7_9EURO|nr:uncharacterized protein PV06_07533 [Exophiala oligosperma]KIW40326.1 hypothetical protein PV06_07533 [Exophiala oligosperma]